MDDHNVMTNDNCVMADGDDIMADECARVSVCYATCASIPEEASSSCANNIRSMLSVPSLVGVLEPGSSGTNVEAMDASSLEP